MNARFTFSLLILVCLVAGCSSSTTSQTADIPTMFLPTLPAPSRSPLSSEIPPAIVTLDPNLVSGFEPQPDDINLERSWLFLDWYSCSLWITEGYPVQVSVYLGGDLPNPCHALRVAVTPANAAGEINLEVYALVNPEVNCIEMLDPFQVKIPLGAYTSGHYSVLVNGGLLGEFEP